MIIGKFLDPRAPSLPQQVGINTDDIAEILQENEEQSANIQKNTDDIELLKQQVSESGTRVRVDGILVAEWSPDEIKDDVQQLRLAQSSDSLAIVGLQSDNITNKQNIALLDAETLKTPVSPPTNIEIVGVGTNNAQIMLDIEKFQPPVNSYLIQKTGTVSPASKFIGTWTKVAENVALPLGDYAPCYGIGAQLIFQTDAGVAPITLIAPAGSGTLPSGEKAEARLFNNSGVAIGNNNGIGLATKENTAGNARIRAHLSEATNAISGVDIWLREA